MNMQHTLSLGLSLVVAIATTACLESDTPSGPQTGTEPVLQDVTPPTAPPMTATPPAIPMDPPPPPVPVPSDTITQTVDNTGARIEVTQVDHPLLGLIVDVPAGAVANATFTIVPRGDNTGVSALPPGMVGLGFGFTLTADAVLAEDITIRFPIREGERRNDHVLSGLFYDATNLAWQATLSTSLEATSFSVTTRKLGLWRTGVVLVDKAPADAISSALIELQTPTIFAEIEAGVREYYDRYVADLTSLTTWTSCEAIATVTNAIRADREEARNAQLTSLAPQCGECSVSTADFADDLLTTIKIKGLNYTADKGVEAFGANYLTEMSAKAIVKGYYDDQINDLSCNYACYLQENPEGFWRTVGVFVATEVSVVLIGWLSERITCS